MSSSLTPDQALANVFRISRLNGWSVALFAGLCTLLTAWLGDLTGILIGALVIASGLMEVHGNRMLRRRNAAGIHWLIGAQVFLLGVMLLYAGFRILNYEGELAAGNLAPDMRDALKLFELNSDDLGPLIRRAVPVFYGAVMLATCLYQGGLALYYGKRKALVEQAFAAPPVAASGTDFSRLR